MILGVSQRVRAVISISLSADVVTLRVVKDDRAFPSAGAAGIAKANAACGWDLTLGIWSLMLVIWCFGFVAHGSAKEEKISTSPDGRYEVVITNFPGDTTPFARIRDKKTKRKIDTDAHGDDRSPEIGAIWREDSKVVALNFSAGKHTSETVLYWVQNGRFSKMVLPDFVMNILGRQGAVAAKFRMFVGVKKFLPDDECLLFAHVEPEYLDPELVTVEDYKVTLRLNNSEQSDLVSVEIDQDAVAK